VPAIADLDRDGRNELVIAGSFWNGHRGYFDNVWVYGFGGPSPHGRIAWGQLMGGARHLGRCERPAAPYRVWVRKAGGGGGTVTSSPPGIDCGQNCSGEFDEDTLVTLEASPTPPSLFVGWTGACSGHQTCTLVMKGDKSVTATFRLPSSTGFYALAPCRALDTRNPSGPFAGQPLAAREERSIVIAGKCGVPSAARAIAVNLTATSATAAGYVRMYAAHTPAPQTSALNFQAGQTRANNAIVSLGGSGDVALYSGQPSGSVHVVVDVTGYFE
jgi:hypothetical protein